jgi:hypothetical protein
MSVEKTRTWMTSSRLAPAASSVVLRFASAYQPSAPMLLVNGVQDSQIPIDDLFLLLRHGDAKDAWVNPVGGHMGRSPLWPSRRIFDEVLMPWMLRRLAPADT